MTDEAAEKRKEKKGDGGDDTAASSAEFCSKSCQVLLPKALREFPKCPGQNCGSPVGVTTVLGHLTGSHGGSDNPAGPGTAVNLGMFGQVVTAGELLLAERTLVRLDAGVRAAVARQLVRAREPWSRRQEDEDVRGTETEVHFYELTRVIVEKHTSAETQFIAS